MSENTIASLNTPEPNPIPNAGQPVWPLVIEDIREDLREAGIFEEWKGTVRLVVLDMVERNELGIKKYGTPLCVGDGRNALVDAYQEGLDQVVYLKKASLESTDQATRSAISSLLAGVIENLCGLKMVIENLKVEAAQ